MKVVLLGVDGYSYGEFQRCKPQATLTLFNSAFRGVVVNTGSLHPSPSWESILRMKPVNREGFLKQVDYLELPAMSSATLVNIPITDPTTGEVSVPYDGSVGYDEEISKVREAVLRSDGAVIAGVTALGRLKPSDPCSIYQAIDKLVKDIALRADDFVLFSPFGVRDGKVEKYGVYISTRPRPEEHDTVKLWEIGTTFLEAVRGE
ncbi:hypothetical protein HS1genome_2240 [Sulfodiicoccus acidiphilus]|uniref:Phosphodiesterase n=1 Tax=Sulfodiicoccus acidiphilus TaxID=1670455 RepID=A0A348B6P9_9CREN|nr:hypothetical protein [Sulfodiicoccus acidiphilus]BBD73851.1 hypothetical protein HS1genome_2240 [Sulfodiicoccus acidiphilus]GGT96324.1 hypothetical protein GCM10007116_12360 [Sulfodiicoccus acidiphilus]